MCIKLPPEFVKFPPMVVVPEASVTIPFEIVKLLETVVDAVPNAQLPPEPLKVRLYSNDPFVVTDLPVVVAVNVKVELAGVSVALVPTMRLPPTEWDCVEAAVKVDPV